MLNELPIIINKDFKEANAEVNSINRVEVAVLDCFVCSNETEDCTYD